ncbi:PH domain-containing protein [Brachybacterium huguangmaarense]
MHDEPQVLYRLSARVLYLTYAGLTPAIVLIPGVIASVLLIRPGLPLAIWLLAVVALTVALVAPFLILARIRFEVTTHGIVVRNALSTHRIPWGEVREVGMARVRWPQFGRTAVHLVDGTTVTAAATDQRTQMFLGRTFWPRPGEYATWSEATSAAIDAHQRYLRGELGTRT